MYKRQNSIFGDIVNERGPETQNIADKRDLETQNIASLRRTIIREIAHQNWLDIPRHFDFIELDDFVIMPDHIHGVLYINKPDKENWQTNKFGTQSQNLASVIRGYKASVKAYATKNDIEFAWQSRYHDRVIRNEEEYRNIQQYIYENPERWLAKYKTS